MTTELQTQQEAKDGRAIRAMILVIVILFVVLLAFIMVAIHSTDQVPMAPGDQTRPEQAIVVMVP